MAAPLIFLSTVSLISFLFLLLLGMRIITNRIHTAVNILFALFCFATAATSFVEFIVRIMPVYEHALFWSRFSIIWPLTTAFLFHFSWLLSFGKNKAAFFVIPAVYAAAAVMIILYADYLINGSAVTYLYGYTINSPIDVSFPHSLVMILQSLIQFAIFAVLFLGVMKKTPSHSRSSIRYIFTAYAVSMFLLISTSLLINVFSVNIPELIGIMYLLFTVFIYIGIERKNLFLLSPAYTAENTLALMQELFFLTDDAGRILRVNDAVCRKFNITAAEIERKTFTETAELFGWDREKVDILTVKDEFINKTIAFDHPDLGRILLSFSKTPIYTKDHIFQGILYIARDVSTEAEQNETIRRGLREKSLLLQEVHHRVKNNLQIIISLLRIKTHDLAESEAKSTLLDFYQQIRIISTIQEELYRTPDLSCLPLRELIPGIAGDLQERYRYAGMAPAQLHFTIDDSFIAIEQGITYGLLFNELLKESLEKNTALSPITIRVSKTAEDEIETELRCGDPDDALFKKPEARGERFDLIATLAQQLQADIKIAEEQSMSSRFVFNNRS
jgi:two-component sensor histidine kinase